MSIMAIHLARDLTLVGADDGALLTAAEHGVLRRCKTSKLHLLPHLDGALVYRGFPNIGLTALAVAVGAQSLEDYRDKIAKRFLGDVAQIPEVHDVGAVGFEAAFVAWDGDHFRAVHHALKDGRLEATEITGTVAAPWLEDWPKMWQADTTETLVDLMRYQSRRLRELEPEAANDDEFHVAALTPDGAVIGRVRA